MYFRFLGFPAARIDGTIIHVERHRSHASSARVGATSVGRTTIRVAENLRHLVGRVSGGGVGGLGGGFGGPTLGITMGATDGAFFLAVPAALAVVGVATLALALYTKGLCGGGRRSCEGSLAGSRRR